MRKCLLIGKKVMEGKRLNSKNYFINEKTLWVGRLSYPLLYARVNMPHWGFVYTSNYLLQDQSRWNCWLEKQMVGETGYLKSYLYLCTSGSISFELLTWETDGRRDGTFEVVPVFMHFRINLVWIVDLRNRW